VGWFASIQDVTERKRSEEALRESEERYRSLAENVPCVLMRFDRQFRVVYLNPQPDQYNPNPVERMMGRTNREMGMPEHLCDLWDAAIERVFRTGSQEEMEFDFEMTSGMRTFALKFAPEFGPDHEVRYVLGVSSDITERRQTEMALQEAYERIQAQAEELEMQAEELRTTNVELEAQTAEIRCYNDELRATADALRESEEQYRTFFDLGTVGMTQADPKTGRLLRVNDRYCEITGYTREELLTATVYDLTWFEDREVDRAKIDRLMKGEIPWYRNEKRLIRRDGKIIWALVSAGLVRDAYGEPLRTVGVLLDITDRKEVEEGIVQLRREQEAFVRHEMKNLFAPLQLFAELLLQETENLSEQQIHYLQRIAESAGRVAGFIDAMRNIHALETGKYELRRSPYPLDIIIWQTIHDLESLTARNGVSVRFSAPEKEAMMMLDRNLLPGVFTNLILNAVEHVAKLPDPGEKVVTVDFREETHKYAVRINNRGEPVPPERLATFFEKYNPGPEKKHGTGLGTTYARLVTKAHGGEISVDSNAEEGTTVTVVLPGK
jgi:two-component system CheB/CheR fusion protein